MNQLSKIMARVLGVTEEEFLEWHRQNEQKKAEEKPAVPTVEQAENPAPIPPDILEKYPTDETVKLTKTNLNKIIVWTTSRWNTWKKADVVERIYELAKAKKDCVEDWHCGHYSENSDGGGWEYRLVVFNGTAKLIVTGFNANYGKRRVFELI